ncbi:MAG: hypothetical protein ACI9RM_001296 [Ulvibacter sp.]|jgi:hypothetical protein
MNINDASDYFESLIIKVNKKSEIKIYETFIAILSDLKNKNLTEEELQSIEEELDMLALKENPENRKKYFKQKLEAFKEYLKEELFLITEGYYTAIGIALGMAFGAAFISVFDSAASISFGLIIGLIIGYNMDAEAEKQNRVLKTKR